MLNWSLQQAVELHSLLERAAASQIGADTRARVAELQHVMQLEPLLGDDDSLTQYGRTIVPKIQTLVEVGRDIDSLKADNLTGSRHMLVIGSSHLDVFGDYDAQLAESIDRPGRVEMNLGGCAYNCAVHLATSSVPVRLLTLVPANSIVGRLIEQQCTAIGIDTRLFQRIAGQVGEPAFVGHRCCGELVSAVTSTFWDSEVTLVDDDTLDVAIQECDAVLTECNLSAAKLRKVLIGAAKWRRPVFVGAVSDVKVIRVREATRELSATQMIDVLSGNAREISLVVGADTELRGGKPPRFPLRCSLSQWWHAHIRASSATFPFHPSESANR